jgi:hypothetical protein
MRFPNRCAPWVLALASGFCTVAGAQEITFHIQRSTLAGYRYHSAPALVEHFAPGTTLDLIRESDNPHDASAVRVEWRGNKLGYVPRTHNAALAWAMDRGESVTAKIAPDDGRRRVRARVEFDIYLR